MFAKSLLKRAAERLGYEVFSTRRAGIQYWRDIDRIKPMRGFTTIFDVGANLGQSTESFLTHAPNAHVYAFEPATENFERLVSNTRHLPNVTCVQSAVGHEPCTMTLFHNSGSEIHSLVSHGRGAGALLEERTDLGCETVDVTSVDRFIDEHGIAHVDLLKTDTEGFDANVLRGARESIRRGMIDFVYAEVAFDPADTHHTRFVDLFDEAARGGLQLLGLYEVVHWQRPSRIGFCNALFTRL